MHRPVPLSTFYPLSKPNTFSLKERSIMRLKFRMTPKQVAELRHKLKKSDSPNRARVLMAENITSPESINLSSPRYNRPMTQPCLSNE